MINSIDSLLLYSGANIPILDLGLSIRQPKLIELANMGEDNYSASLALITTQKEDLDLSSLPAEVVASKKNLDIILTIISTSKEKELYCKLLFSMFLGEEVNFDFENGHLIIGKRDSGYIVDKHRYDTLIFYIKEISGLGMAGVGKSEYNPASDAAKRIIDKIKEGKSKKAKAQSAHTSFIKNSVSCIAAWEKRSVEDVFKTTTLLQLYDQISRIRMIEEYHAGYQAQLAGAKDVELKYWQEEI